MKKIDTNDRDHIEAKKLVDKSKSMKYQNSVRIRNGIKYIGMMPEDEWIKHCKRRKREFFLTKVLIYVALLIFAILTMMAIGFLTSY